MFPKHIYYPNLSAALRIVCLVMALFAGVVQAGEAQSGDAIPAEEAALAMQTQDHDKPAGTQVSAAEQNNGPVLLVPLVLAVLAMVAVSRRRQS
ncbi:hypothetical protein Q4485_09950 [Granulosicoccaceae sp. 1_MG-2023]|nr:hypothetical protein [Granulosicoccaceae sp. 1_MG-2023]